MENGNILKKLEENNLERMCFLSYFELNLLENSFLIGIFYQTLKQQNFDIHYILALIVPLTLSLVANIGIFKQNATS